MNSISREKYEFFKGFWIDMLTRGIDIYSGYYFVDLIIIIEDIQQVVALYDGEKYNLSEIKRLFKEFNTYINKNYFYYSYYSNEIKKLKNISRNIDLYINKKKKLESELNKIYIKVNDISNMKLISKSIDKEINNNIPLAKSILNLQSLATDYICLLLRRNFSLEYLSKDIFKVYILDDLDNYLKGKKVTYKDEFKSFISKPFKKEVDITYVFRIKGLKIIMPQKIKNIIIYNPLREDLLKWKFNVDMMDSEVDLLYSDEEDIFINNRNNSSILIAERQYDIEYADCHARVTIKSRDIESGINIAKQLISDILDSIKYVYNLNNISISNAFCADMDNGYRKYSTILNKNKNRVNKYLDVKYSPRLFDETFGKELSDPNSKINKLLTIKDEKIEYKFKKSLYWYLRGHQSQREDDKFINYWIALEFMTDTKRGNTIKRNVIVLGSKLFVLTSFNSELYYLYSNFKNIMYGFKGNSELRKTIEKIDGMENFYFKVNSKILADSLSVFNKNIYNKFINYKINEFINVYNDYRNQHKVIKQLIYTYKNIIGRMYRIRNSIIHNAMMKNNQVIIYSNYLEILCGNLLNNILIEENNNIKDWNPEKIELLYNEWIDCICKNKIINII